MKNAIFALFMVLILAVGLTSCGGGEKATQAATAVPETTTAEPVSVVLTFPDGAPRLNESAVFKCTVINNSAIDKKMSIDLGVQATAFTLESGSLSWSGTVPANSEATVIEAMLKSFHTGHWQIDAKYHIDTEPDGYGGDFTSTIYVQSGIPSSQWGTTPPWQK
jgi:hypothetical protein